MSKSKSPLGAVLGKFRSVMVAIFCLAFGMGAFAQAPAGFIAAIGVLSALFLVKLAVERRGR
jgi:ABC-type phosphate/phosphonate transport system permease subunit